MGILDFLGQDRPHNPMTPSNAWDYVNSITQQGSSATPSSTTTPSSSTGTDYLPWDYRNPVTQAKGYVWPGDTSEQRLAAKNNYYYRAAERGGRIPKSMDPDLLNMDLLNQSASNISNQRGFNVPGGTYPSSSSSSSGESRTAIDWSSPLGKTLLPMIQERATGLPGLADSLSGTLQGQYNSLMRQSLQPQAFQGVLNQLASRGVLSSSVAEDALAGTASQIARDIANQGYMSQLQGVAAQMKVPGMLGQLAELARVAEVQSTSQQEYSDPLAPYTLMAQMLMSG